MIQTFKHRSQQNLAQILNFFPVPHIQKESTPGHATYFFAQREPLPPKLLLTQHGRKKFGNLYISKVLPLLLSSS
jgi:hypothetical protein